MSHKIMDRDFCVKEPDLPRDCAYKTKTEAFRAAIRIARSVDYRNVADIEVLTKAGKRLLVCGTKEFRSPKNGHKKPVYCSTRNSDGSWRRHGASTLGSIVSKPRKFPKRLRKR